MIDGIDIDAIIRKRWPNLRAERAEEMRIRCERDFRTMTQLMRFAGEPETFIAMFQAAISTATRDGMLQAAALCDEIERQNGRKVPASFAAKQIRTLVARNEKTDGDAFVNDESRRSGEGAAAD